MLLDRKHEGSIEHAAEIFKGLGNPIRIRIVASLRGGNLRVMELADQLNYSQPIISQQLKILKSAGIVHRVRDRDTYCYALTNPHFSDMIRCMEGCLGI